MNMIMIIFSRLADIDWERAVTDWYEEVTLFSNKKVKPFKFAAAYGHYSQLVWANTDKIGCGATSYREGKWFVTLYTCNYGPNGNFINGEMYNRGEACSRCPGNSTCSDQYPGLCSSVSPDTRPAPVFRATTRRPQPTTTTLRTTSTALTTTPRTTRSPPRQFRPSSSFIPRLINNEVETGEDDSEMLVCDFDTDNDKSCEVKYVRFKKCPKIVL